MADQNFPVNCGFFDAQNSDRLYSADDMNKPYSRVVADGVFATNQGTPSSDLQVVSAGTGMQITVQQGQGIFAAKWFENNSPIAITVPDNNSIYPRRDSVIVQVDKRISGRVGNIVYRTGTASTNPQPPDIGTVENVIEYRIANIYVAPGANAINNDAIVDLRGSSECPWVTSLIQQVDTSTLWNQYQTAFQKLYEAFTLDYEEYTEEQREAWEDFISQLTEELTVSTNVAMYTSYYTAQGTVTTVPINIPSFNPATDVLMVFINGLMADSGKYTINSAGTSITLTNSIAAGNSVSFIVLKSLIGGDIESAISMVQRLDDRLANFMADSGWIKFTLESGAAAYDSNSAPAVRCIGNRVYLRGAFKNMITVGNTICTLPVSFRPSVDHTFTTSAANSGGTANDYVTITISATNGTIKLSAKSGTITSTDKISLATNFLANTGNSVAMIYTYKGSVASYGNLPANPEVGDVYMIETANSTHNIEPGDDVMWNGSEWELLNAVISSEEIDTIINAII